MGRHRTLARAADTKRHYIFWPCFPLSPTHRDRGMDKMAWEDDWEDRQARRRKRRGWVAVSSWEWFITIPSHKAVGERPQHMKSTPLTAACLGHMQTVQHGQAQT